MITIVTAVLFTTITILIPPPFLKSILQLTDMSISFAFLLIAIAIANFVVTWFSEKVIFVQVRNLLDRISVWRGKRKQWDVDLNAKRYQVIERM
jgi:hypothetical protein